MRAQLLAAAVLLVTLGCDPSTWDEAAAIANDDAVYRAVIDSTIRPEVRRLYRVQPDQPEPPIVVEDETHNSFRVSEFERPSDPDRDTFEDALRPSTRRLLGRSVRERSSKPQPLNLKSTEGVVLVKPSEFWPLIRRDWKKLGGYSGFSRPGYAGSYALVYATYSCGGLCGHGWLVLLRRDSNGWRVVASELQWVS